MKMDITEAEWFPVYLLRDASSDETKARGKVVDLPEELIARWKKADEEFSAVQEEIANKLGVF